MFIICNDNGPVSGYTRKEDACEDCQLLYKITGKKHKLVEMEIDERLRPIWHVSLNLRNGKKRFSRQYSFTITEHEVWGPIMVGRRELVHSISLESKNHALVQLDKWLDDEGYGFCAGQWVKGYIGETGG